MIDVLPSKTNRRSASRSRSALNLRFAGEEVMRGALSGIDQLRPALNCRSLEASWHDVSIVPQHRKLHRVPFDCVVELRAFDSSSHEISDDIIIGRSRNISPSGICVSCPEPISSRHVALMFPETSTSDLFIVEFRWCRFTRERIYFCGGHFVGVSSTDVN